jgi:hypothetical protein
LWRVTPSSIAVHLNQSGFASNLVESFACQACNETQWPPHIDPEFLLIPSRHLSMLMTLLRKSDGRTLIKVSSAVSVSFIYYMP